MSQSTQWTTMGQYSTKPTEQQTASQPTQWTEQQTTSQSTKSNLNLASSLTVQNQLRWLMEVRQQTIF